MFPFLLAELDAEWVCSMKLVGRGSPSWQLDSDVTCCSGCQTDFSLFVRKHHCRLCGRVFCWLCSSQTIGKEEHCGLSGRTAHSTVRVCTKCHDSFVNGSNSDEETDAWTIEQSVEELRALPWPRACVRCKQRVGPGTTLVPWFRCPGTARGKDVAEDVMHEICVRATDLKCLRCQRVIAPFATVNGGNLCRDCVG